MEQTNHLEPVDLMHRIWLGQSALLNMLDPTARHLPYWTANYADGDLVGFNEHGDWDKCHDVPRAIHALVMAENVTGDKLPDEVISDLSDLLFELFDAGDGLPGMVSSTTGKRFVHLHNVREVTHALASLVKRGDGRAERRAGPMFRALITAMDSDGRLNTDRLPSCCFEFEPYSSQPHQEGRALDALVRYYRVSQDDTALELASLIAKFAIEHCFTQEGVVTQEAGTHVHSINAIVAGMAGFALLTNDANLLQQVKRIFDTGLPSFNSSFGWSMETANRYEFADGRIYRGESNNTGDLLRVALHLGRGVFAEYFGIAERILRSHLLPSQLIDVSGMSDDPDATDDRLRNLASRVRGGFAFPTPNELLYDVNGPLSTYDVTSGAVDALCESWHWLVSEDPLGLRVNMLFGCEKESVVVKTALPAAGHVDLAVSGMISSHILVRIPGWVDKEHVKVCLNGAQCPNVFVGPYVCVSASGREPRISIDFPLAAARTVESICYKRYEIDWLGDQITNVSPAGKFLPMFPPCT